MIDTGAEANICKYNCLPEDKWEKLKTPIVVTGFNNEGSMITYKAKNIKVQIWDKILTIDMLYLEYIINNINEIFRLKQLSEEYYNKYYYILP